MKKLLTLLLLSLASGSASAAEWGRLHGAPMPEPGQAGPPHHSQVFIADAEIRNGRAALDVPLDTARGAALVVFEERPVIARSPRNRELPAVAFRNPVLESMDVPAMGSRIELGTLGRGQHAVNIETARGNGALRYAVVQPDSELEMVVRLAPLAARNGEPVTVTAELAGAVAESTRVVARVRGAGRIVLRDDGQQADEQAGDDIYTGQFVAPRGKGLREAVVRVDADGEMQNGSPFRRTASATAMVSHSSLQLAAADVQVAGNNLRIPIRDRKGRYRIEAVYGADGRSLAWIREDWQGQGRGASHVNLPRPEIAASADRVVVRVLDLETLALAAEFAIELEPVANAAMESSRTEPRLPASKAAAASRFGAGRNDTKD